MDTDENQLAYPQPNQHKKGCGFPVMGVCGVVNLSHGGWETLSTSAHTQHDLSATYDELCSRYYERWHIELKFRDIKTILGMEFIRGKIPEIAEKTIRVLQLNYNMIYALIQEARRDHLVGNFQTSFKSCVDQILSQSGSYNGHHKHRYKREELHEKLLVHLASETLIIRKGRHEPRARKRRPKKSQLLTQPRHKFTEIHHRNNYRKSA